MTTDTSLILGYLGDLNSTLSSDPAVDVKLLTSHARGLTSQELLSKTAGKVNIPGSQRGRKT